MSTFNVKVVVIRIIQSMGDLHPKFILSKRFPAHTAIELCDIGALVTMFSDPGDAQFYLDKRLPVTEISALHQVITF